MTTKPTTSATPAADQNGKAKEGEKGKVVTPARVAMGAAAIGSAAIAAAVLFASRTSKPKA